jgi:hypothetical protein
LHGGRVATAAWTSRTTSILIEMRWLRLGWLGSEASARNNTLLRAVETDAKSLFKLVMVSEGG